MFPRTLMLVLVCLAGCAPCPQRETLQVLLLGDSLTVGPYVDKPWAAQLPSLLADACVPIELEVQAHNGFTLRDGRQLWHQRVRDPQVVLLALGANDYLKGIPERESRRDLEMLVSLCRQAGARVILVGVALPDVESDFYQREAAQHHLRLVPDLLEGVAGNPALLLPDKLHPNQKGHDQMARHMTGELKRLL